MDNLKSENTGRGFSVAAALCPRCTLCMICKYKANELEVEYDINEILKRKGFAIIGNWHHTCPHFHAKEEDLKGLTG